MLKRVICSVMVFFLVFTQFSLSVAQASTLVPDGWRVQPVFMDTSILVPDDNWTIAARMIQTGDWLMSGDDEDSWEAWAKFGREDAAILGLNSNQISDMRIMPGTTAPYVFARHDVINNTARIFIMRTIRNAQNEVMLIRTSFTPCHGEHYSAMSAYSTETRKIMSQEGYNPLAAYSTDPRVSAMSARTICGTDSAPEFVNISAAGLEVAVGLAMRRYNAGMGLIASYSLHTTQREWTTGNAFRKTKHVEVNYYPDPVWRLALPVGTYQPAMSGWDSTLRWAQLAICANGENPDADGNCATMVVKSGIVVDRMEGGVFTSRDMSDLVHRYYQSKKGWTMFSMLLLGAFVGAGLGALGFQSGLTFAAGGTNLTSAALTGAAWGAGLNLAIGGFSSGSFNLSQTQNFMQSTYELDLERPTIGQTPYYNPLIDNANQNYQVGQTNQAPSPVDSRADQSIAVQKLRDRTYAEWDSGNNADRRLLVGNCPSHLSRSDCEAAGLDAGIGQRADDFRQGNGNALSHRVARCKRTTTTDAQLRQCVAFVMTDEAKRKPAP